MVAALPRLPLLVLPFLLATAALAGCTGTAAPDNDPVPDTSSDGAMTIVGLVQNESFAPIPGAAVSLRLTNLTTATDAGGLFTFSGLALGPYVVDVLAEGFAPANLTAEPRLNVSLTFVLAPPTSGVPDPQVMHFQGLIQCALEAVIITPSCDTLVDVTGQASLFDDISTFEAGVNTGWTAAVLDLDFDPNANPGLDGLRITVQGRNDADKLNAYQQYGRFHGSEPFTVLLEPGQTYEDGNEPVPANATSLQFEVYPHGHGYHAACVPVFAICPLGVGTGLNVRFDLYVTLFYGPVPDGYSLLA